MTFVAILPLLACSSKSDGSSRPEPQPPAAPHLGVPLTPGPDCDDLGEPTTACVGYAPGPPDCGGTLYPATGDEPSRCEADTTLAQWCANHLPCWEGPGCPTFHEFLWVSGWLDSDLPEVGDYEWTYIDQGTGTYMAYTARCWWGDEQLEVHDMFYWRQDEQRLAIFSAFTGELLSVVEYDACCGDEVVDERRWGTIPEFEHSGGCDHYWAASSWEICSNSSLP